MEQNVTNLIERLEVFEERAGVRLESLGASATTWDDDDDASLSVRGEVHSREGTRIEQNIKLVVSLHDTSGSIVGTCETYIKAGRFLWI